MDKPLTSDLEALRSIYGIELCVESVTWISYSDTIGIVVLSFFVLMVILTLVVIVLFSALLWMPVVRSTGVVFGYMVLAGVLVSYFTIFFYLGEPTDSICAAQPWLLLVWAFVFGYLLQPPPPNHNSSLPNIFCLGMW